MEFEEINALGQAIDSTWGRASTNGTSARFSVKAQMYGDDGLSVRYVTIVTLGSLDHWRQMEDIHHDQAMKVIDQYVKQLKKEYSDIAGKSLTIKKIGKPQTSFEAITHSAYSPKKDAYYRVAVEYEVA